jgi:hypothetical protein
VQIRIKEALGIALLLAVSTMVARAFLNVRRHWAKADGRSGQASSGGELPVEPGDGCRAVAVRPMPTLLIGALGGLVVGMTSVGSGSLIIVMLLLLYPQLRASELVGTDLIQAVPLVGSAALGHLLFGDFHLDLTTSLLIGSLPGVYLGARVSVRAPGKVIRRALAFVLTASGLKLLGAGNVQLLAALVVASAAGPLLWRWVHATGGLRRPPGRAPEPGVSLPDGPAFLAQP